MKPISTPTDVKRWEKYDQDTVAARREVTDPNGTTYDVADHVDHSASAKANLKEAKQAVLDALNPTNHFQNTWAWANDKGTTWAKLLACLMIPIDACLEMYDWMAAPFKLVKDTSDAAAHGTLAGVNKLLGRRD